MLEILLPSQNIKENWSKKFDVFGSKFGLNTSSLFDQFSLIFCDKGSIIKLKTLLLYFHQIKL
jgi:hypothetical protein